MKTALFLLMLVPSLASAERVLFIIAGDSQKPYECAAGDGQWIDVHSGLPLKNINDIEGTAMVQCVKKDKKQ